MLRRRWIYSLEKFVGRRVRYLADVLSLMKRRFLWWWFDVDISFKEGSRWFVVYREMGWCGLSGLRLRLGDVSTGVGVVDAE